MSKPPRLIHGVISHLSATPVDVDAIVTLRAEYRREMACQIVHDSWHRRGFTQSYLLHDLLRSRWVGGDMPVGPTDS